MEGQGFEAVFGAVGCEQGMNSETLILCSL